MKLDNVADIYELSPLQEGMLFHTLLTPGSGMYFEQAGIPLYGPLDVPSFERAWQKVLDRHSILRTSFHWENLDKPLQVVHRDARLPVQYLDWSGHSAVGQEQGLEAFLKADRERGFELSRAPLLRLTVIALADGARYVVFSVHHLLLDGWSSDLVYREAAAMYEAYCRGEQLELPRCRPYGDYIAWLQQQDLSAAESFWRTMLKGYAGPSAPGVGPAPGEREDCEEQQTRLSAATTTALQSMARRHQLTLNTLVQGAWALLLSRYSGDDDVVFGYTVSGRPPSLPGAESMVGLFINTLPLRVQISSNARLIPWLRQIQAGQFEARKYEYSPLVKIQGWSEMPHSTPLFQSLLDFGNFPIGGPGRDQPARINGVRSYSRTNYPLNLLVGPGAELLLKIMYVHPRYSSEAIARMLGHLRTILEGMVAGSEQRRLGEISMLTEAEWRQLGAWNETATSYPREATIHELFAEQARRAPGAVAVSVEGAEVTYGALNRRANRLARRLRAAGVGRETVAAICVEGPIELVTGMLGILKAGGAYVPLDPAYPEERLRFMLEDSGAVAVVTTGGVSARVPARGTRLVLDEGDAAGGDEGAEEEPGEVSTGTTAEDLAYVMYTSGSTGRPKGAAIPHRAVVRTVRNTNYISLGPSDTIAQISNVSFDAATFEIWGALLNGGRLAGIPREVTLAPDDFAAALRRARISTIFVTTDLFNQLVRERPELFQTVGDVLVGGSAIDAKWIGACLRHGRPQRLVHVYGPTESTTFASWHRIDGVPEGGAAIPIGTPLANTELHVLGRDMNPLPVGVTGEIYIGGDGLARGYLNRPELTAERFVPDPFSGRAGARLYRTGDRARRRADGALEFVGRVDDQVKIRGFRVEVSEIEAVLRTHPGVRDAIVLAREEAAGTRRLVAYVAAASGEVSVGDLRGFLEKKLPEYMVPSAFVRQDALPLTRNGKVDRKALAAAGERLAPEEPYVEPRSPVEKTLAGIWGQVLGVERVGIHDNFFELGGDSIISIQIIARARETGLDLTLRQLFDNQTVSKLAAVAGTGAGVRAEQGTLEGDVPLIPIQLWFLEQESVEPHHFNQAALIEAPAGLDPALLGQATEHLLVHHDALRLRLRREDGRWRQTYTASAGPVPFRCVDLKTVTEPELRARIEQGATEAQGSLDLEAGPIVRVVWFDLGDRPGRLLFVIHHLAVDSVSWRILMEDFWRTYEQLARGQEVALPAKTSSVRQWARRLNEHAQSAKAREELAYWMAAASGPAGRLPVDLPGGENVAGAVRTVTVELDEEQTRALVQETPRAYQTQINDVLLTALAQALGRWTGERAIRFDLERHGREPLFDDVDLTRTVGWFTTIFPVRLELTTEDPGGALKAVKEQLRRIPNRGLAYGLLRYLSTDPRVTAQLAAVPGPDVGFNYLGQHALTPELESSGAARSPRARRRHLLEIDGAIAGGRLRVQWGYSEHHHRRATIERVAEDFIGHLRSLIAHCRSPKGGGFTPSDFAQAKLSQKDLDKLVAAVDKSERPAG
jgi:amino acid adenylation domain-containing protein/non-ribosomal peptide synthase protein (TIGR01720 family)